MASKLDNRALRLHLMVLLCAVLFALVLHVKMPVPPHPGAPWTPNGAETWSSGQKLKPVPILVVAPILLVVFLLEVPRRHVQCWRRRSDSAAVPRYHRLLNLELYLRPPPVL
jgi:hypothetical protein